MLSFPSSIVISGNGKTETAGEAPKDVYGWGPSRADNQGPCNGGTGSNKTKTGRKALAAERMSRMLTTIPTSAAAKLEPLGISIPKLSEKPQENDTKVLEIPRMDSPLFKDVPQMNVQPSSGSSSSSDGNSSSDDSSSLEDDSDDDDGESEKKDIKDMSSQPLSPVKTRTPIKLTISNLGKPSSKVVSSATRGSLNNNNTVDSETLGFDQESEVKSFTNPQKENTQEILKDCQSKTNSLPAEIMDEPKDISEDNNPSLRSKNKDVTESSCSDLSINDKCVYMTKDVCQAGGDQGSVFSCASSEVSSVNFLGVHVVGSVKLGDKKNNIDAHENDKIAMSLSTDDISSVKSKESDHEIIQSKSDEFVLKDAENISEFKPSSRELISEEIKCDSDHAASEGNKLKVKNPDGSTLLPVFSKSPEHLKCRLQNSMQVKDGRDNGILEAVSVPLDAETSKKESLTSAGANSRETTEGKTCPSFISDRFQTLSHGTQITDLHSDKQLLNFPKDNSILSKDKILDKIVDTGIFDKESSDKNVPECEIKDQMESNKSSDMTLVNFQTTKTNPDSFEIIHNKIPAQSTQTAEPQCKDVSSLSEQLLKITECHKNPLKMSSKESSNKISPDSKINNEGCAGFKQGVPDKTNPFITWTKFDDDNSGPVSSTLPATNLVQALACTPFSLLVLPGDPSHPQLSPLSVAVPQVSPLSVAVPQVSPGSGQLPGVSPGVRLSSPTASRLMSTPGHGPPKQPQLSPPLSQQVQGNSDDGSRSSNEEDGKVITTGTQKSKKRTLRLSNIIDTLRTSKEKQAVDSSLISVSEQDRRSTLALLMGAARKSPLSELPSHIGQTLPSSSSSSSSPVFQSLSLRSEQGPLGDRALHNPLGFSHHVSIDTQQMARSSVDASRTQSINNSFNTFKNDLDKGKRILENLEVMRNGFIDPYGKSRKMDGGHFKTRSKPSSLSLPPSSSVIASTQSSPRPSSQQSSSHPYPSLSSSASSSFSNTRTTTSAGNARTATSASTSGSGLINGGGNSISSAAFQAAPSATLTAGHMELNAAAANFLTFQHMYGMHDPYLMKTFMSNPLYFQRIMELQKQGVDPLMLQQLEMIEAAAAMEKSKASKEQQAAMSAQSILWQAQAMSILQHQHLQQLHQQQLQQQVAAATRERETLAAIMANKSHSLSSHAHSGSISTGQSAKSLLTSSPPSSSSSSKRQHSSISSSPSEIYQRDGSSLDKRPRSSHLVSTHIPNHTVGQTSNSSQQSSSSSTLSLPSKPSSRPASKQRVNSEGSSNQTKHDFLDFAALHHSAASLPHLWGFPQMLHPSLADMTGMPQLFERPSEAPRPPPPPSSSSSSRPKGSEVSGAEVLDLSVKPKMG